MKNALLACSIAAALIAGCAKKEAPIAQQQPAATTAAPAPTVAQPAATQPQTVAATEAPAGAINGKVVETMDAAGYTYVKLKTASGDVWAAVPQTKVAVGSNVTLAGNMTLDNFESKTLKRKFDHIVFGTIAGPQNAPMMASAATQQQGAKSPHPPMGGPQMAQMAAQHISGGAANLGEIKVAKAEGAEAKTVAEVWSGKASLKDAPVAIRGKVVKFLPGIMGKNWLHLRDGSGSAEKGDNDITVTTDDTAAVGDVVLVKGIVHTDKDFGAGYSYAVIVENAKVTK